MVIKRRFARKISRAAKRGSAMLSAKRRAELSAKAKEFAITMKKPYRAYHEIQTKIDKSWKKLCVDMKHRSRKAIEKSKNELLLLMGECDYMVRECKRCIAAKNH